MSVLPLYHVDTTILDGSGVYVHDDNPAIPNPIDGTDGLRFDRIWGSQDGLVMQGGKGGAISVADKVKICGSKVMNNGPGINIPQVVTVDPGGTGGAIIANTARGNACLVPVVDRNPSETFVDVISVSTRQFDSRTNIRVSTLANQTVPGTSNSQKLQFLVSGNGYANQASEPNVTTTAQTFLSWVFYGGDPADAYRGMCCNPKNAATWDIASDARLKRKIEEVDTAEALDLVKKLKPSTYCYKGDDTEKKRCGYLAQDLREVFPEMAFGGPTLCYMDKDDLPVYMKCGRKWRTWRRYYKDKADFKEHSCAEFGCHPDDCQAPPTPTEPDKCCEDCDCDTVNNAVSDPDKMLSINTGDITTYHTAAIKELEKRIGKQQEEIENIKQVLKL